MQFIQKALIISLKQKKINALPFQNFGSSHGHGHSSFPVGAPAPALSDKIIWINIQNRIGQFERISAFEGESLLTSLSRNKVSGLIPGCEGGEDIITMLEQPIDPNTYGPFCSGCQVIVSEPWRTKMGELHILEQRNIDRGEYPATPNTRLACCVLVQKWMNEMIISISQNAPAEADDQYSL
ncbi:hypothetical protein IMG5_181470 [Ichthyophthirius multifiliis]|uniref:2Fe-2S ferredoxin-type domain-containing protein n=1 Tax=Ichthyophthirius multifiliis TaxID=5932 RepID=G0R2U6_ICHMU|nr:hypothetical protein IMG5_181470 [Ichthyophthirius multifiliis]EGR28218.1 hypothetical protein IMG5_181470 [Ichthyophthirius multifiliis]|eukprot:XP_004027563.1 hypothetical protein IMG5_181470 [Ichthyophthirius multifiliis]